jgi:uncharacterized protein YneF (UPF0154 family)
MKNTNTVLKIVISLFIGLFLGILISNYPIINTYIKKNILNPMAWLFDSWVGGGGGG